MYLWNVDQNLKYQKTKKYHIWIETIVIDIVVASDVAKLFQHIFLVENL